ncbi:MAG: hypothetical protein LBN71_00465 [Tannerella sp.]|jgi:soluble P-type ATPase|nr:hypothetical protein [Tannerella sp.]
MKTQKLFRGKFEDLPVIGEFILDSTSRDMADFSGYSSLFSENYFGDMNLKITACREQMRSWTVIKELKAVTVKLVKASGDLRPLLNKLEGYVKLAAKDLDIHAADIGLTEVRYSISKDNTEGLITNAGKLLVAVKRNMQALEDK